MHFNISYIFTLNFVYQDRSLFSSFLHLHLHFMFFLNLLSVKKWRKRNQVNDTLTYFSEEGEDSFYPFCFLKKFLCSLRAGQGKRMEKKSVTNNRKAIWRYVLLQIPCPYPCPPRNGWVIWSYAIHRNALKV